MSDDKTEDMLVATTRMSKETETTAVKTTKKKVARKAASKKVAAKPAEKAAQKSAVSKPANNASDVQSSASIAGPTSSHGAAIQHGRRIWPD